MKSLKQAMLKKYVKLLIAFFCGSTAVAEIQPMNVLFVGNSFTHMNSMPQMFEKIAVSKSIKLNVLMSAKSNHTFKMHSERADLYQDINRRKWDYVILQGFSRELSYGKEHIDTATIPYFQKIVDTLKANNPCVKILLYMTWGYENGYAYMNELGSYEEMTESIEAGYRYLSDLYDFPIVPVGNVWKEIRKYYPEMDLYREDEHHPTKLGSYVVASSFYSAIFRTSPVGAYSSDIPDNTAVKIQKTAFDYVMANLHNYRLDEDILDVVYKFTKDGRYEAKCTSSFNKASSVLWEFGDGNSSDEANVTHYYSTYGKYKVKLTVEDSCGQRIVYRNVYFNKPYQPLKLPESKPKTQIQNVKRKI